jgi:2-hydroxy-3-keto-5-methylthiopentenyl-1-phosphate phosphatase
MLIATDFDGTISKQDGLKSVLDHFLGDRWRPIEHAMKSGEMPERQGLRLCMEMLKASDKQVIEYLEKNIELDESFGSFARWAKSLGHSVVILSSGIQEFIEVLLSRDGMSGIELWANRAQWNGQAWSLYEKPGPRICESQSHCKCSSILRLAKKGEPVVFVGDGHSDRCAVKKAHQVFAKAWLADFCSKEKIAFTEYHSFADVRAALSESGLRSDVRHWG